MPCLCLLFPAPFGNLIRFLRPMNDEQNEVLYFPSAIKIRRLPATAIHASRRLPGERGRLREREGNNKMIRLVSDKTHIAWDLLGLFPTLASSFGGKRE